MKKCDEAHRREPQAENGPPYCKEAQEFTWVNQEFTSVNGDRIHNVLVQLTEFAPSYPGPGTLSQRVVTFDLKTGRVFNYSDLFRPESRGEVDKLIFSSLAGQMKQQFGIDYPWAQFLKDKKETYEFQLVTRGEARASNVNDPRLVTLTILDFPDEWFNQRAGMIVGLEPHLSLDQLKSYANPGGPLALLLPRKQASTETNSK